MSLRDNLPLYFYELHEGEEDVFTDVLLASEVEYDDQEFLELVLASRKRLLDSFEEDSLTEAIARDLEARHGFVVVDDRVLTVAVTVSAEEGETQVAVIGDVGGVLEDDPDERYRSLVFDVEKEDRRWGER
ncbi:MAG: hypothetical protein U0869_12785 [Chloroflexota bacterium]